MSIFIDTAGLLAVLDADDQYHAKANQTWQDILSSEEDLFTTNYILIETFALVQHRLGLKAVKVFQDDILPVLDIQWVTEAIHQAAVGLLMMAAKRRLSLVDCVSFVVMHQKGIKKVFTLDRHFEEQGFEAIPS